MYERNEVLMKKVLFISSTGGHLDELMQLKSMFKKYDYHIITEKTKSTIGLKDKYKDKINYMVYGTKDHKLVYPFKLFINCLKSTYYYFKIRPEFIVTTGAHTAGPMCVLGHIFGSKIIYIETFANRKSKTITGKLIYKFADLFIVQWESMKELYPNSTYGGWIY
jgi:UDP-N-acetylglucosamine:LPS N-acetylglucosamine transferase